MARILRGDILWADLDPCADVNKPVVAQSW